MREQPTARAIATHVVEMLADVQAPAAAIVQRVVTDGESSIGLVGGAVLLPGGGRHTNMKREET